MCSSVSLSFWVDVYLWFCMVGNVLLTDPEIERLVNHPVHLKPFGYIKSSHQIDEMRDFPFSQHFFENYVYKSKPLLMKDAAKLSRAFTDWTDEYFLNLDEPVDNAVVVETKKKENRKQPIVQMSFKDFVHVYQDSDQFMVNTVPSFIAEDVVVPGPLQCEAISDALLVDSLMWFSNGGTKSVVHTDSVENINCLFAGEKELVMIDPTLYGDKVDIDHPEGAYSDVDVDRVDLTKYPGLADVEYYFVKMEPGDCLFIPYKWIHQVRSFHRNIAVNVWWDHHQSKNVNLKYCPDSFDPHLTLAHVEMVGFSEVSLSKGALRDHFLDFIKKEPATLEKFIQIIVGDVTRLEEMDAGVGYKQPIVTIFNTFDKNVNGKIDAREIDQASDEDWDIIKENMGLFDEIVESVEDRWHRYQGEPDYDYEDEEDEDDDDDDEWDRDEL